MHTGKHKTTQRNRILVKQGCVKSSLPGLLRLGDCTKETKETACTPGFVCNGDSLTLEMENFQKLTTLPIDEGGAVWSVKRFERSNRLDTALYKNYLF